MTEQNSVSKKKNKSIRYNEYYDLQESYDNLYKKSKNNLPNNKLYELIIDKDNILRAFRAIKRNTGSKTKGTNGHSIKYLENYSVEGLVNLVTKRLRNYTPDTVRRVYIPKSSGGTRPLGIPTIEDRLIQQCILQVLEPICEAQFHNSSFGFRPARSTHHAIARCQHIINHSRNHFVVDIDIKGFFDNVNHAKLLKQLWSIGVRDKRVLSIISKMLKAEIINEGTPTKGTPQGGILSPLLANVVLNELDWWISNQWETKSTKHNYATPSGRNNALKKTKLKPCYIVRYADDFKIFTNSRTNAKKLFEATKSWLKERLDLEVSPDKSKITNLRKNGSDFLGFRLRAVERGTSQLGYVCHSNIAPDRRNKVKEVVKHQLKLIRKSPTQNNVNKLNSIILGMHNYYKVATHVSTDFYVIKHKVYGKYKTLLRRKIFRYKGVSNKIIDKFYPEYPKALLSVGSIPIYPLEYIHTKNAIQINPNVTPYTEIGRSYIHNYQQVVSIQEIEYLRNSVRGNYSIEYHDNRISRFVGQNGKCGVTGLRLEVKDVHCHHKTPLSLGGTDKYENLIIVHKMVHRLIHTSNIKEVIERTSSWTTKSKQILNKLRMQCGVAKVKFS